MEKVSTFFLTIWLLLGASGCYSTNYIVPGKSGSKTVSTKYGGFIVIKPVDLKKHCRGKHKKINYTRSFADQFLGAVTFGFFYRESVTMDCKS